MKKKKFLNWLKKQENNKKFIEIGRFTNDCFEEYIIYKEWNRKVFYIAGDELDWLEELMVSRLFTGIKGDSFIFDKNEIRALKGIIFNHY